MIKILSPIHHPKALGSLEAYEEQHPFFGYPIDFYIDIMGSHRFIEKEGKGFGDGRWYGDRRGNGLGIILLDAQNPLRLYTSKTRSRLEVVCFEARCGTP